MGSFIHQQKASLPFNAAAKQHLPLLLPIPFLNDVGISEACQLHVFWWMGNDGLLAFVPLDKLLVTYTKLFLPP